jgi:hypothetical protein
MPFGIASAFFFQTGKSVNMGKCRPIARSESEGNFPTYACGLSMRERWEAPKSKLHAQSREEGGFEGASV